jgi:hypothetical protein
MTKATMEELDEKPLDPELEKVRRKMLRLLGVSIGIMFVGVMAVLVAIVYKLNEPTETEAGVAAVPVAQQVGTSAPVSAAVPAAVIATSLPAGLRIDTVAVDGTRIVLAGQISGRAHVVIYDLAAGGIVAEIATGGE